MTKGLSTIATEAQELKATISQLATALTNNEQAHTRLAADMEAAQTKLKALQEASVAAFDEMAAIAERREPEAPLFGDVPQETCFSTSTSNGSMIS